MKRCIFVFGLALVVAPAFSQALVAPHPVKNSCTGQWAIRMGPHTFMGKFHYQGTNKMDAVHYGQELKFPDSVTAANVLKTIPELVDYVAGARHERDHQHDSIPHCHYNQ